MRRRKPLPKDVWSASRKLRLVYGSIYCMRCKQANANGGDGCALYRDHMFDPDCALENCFPAFLEMADGSAPEMEWNGHDPLEDYGEAYWGTWGDMLCTGIIWNDDIESGISACVEGEAYKLDDVDGTAEGDADGADGNGAASEDGTDGSDALGTDGAGGSDASGDSAATGEADGVAEKPQALEEDTADGTIDPAEGASGAPSEDNAAVAAGANGASDGDGADDADSADDADGADDDGGDMPTR
jgi:hypothetical protein